MSLNQTVYPNGLDYSVRLDKYLYMKKTSILLIFFLSSTINAFSGIVILNGLTHVHSGEAGNHIVGKIKIRNEK